MISTGTFCSLHGSQIDVRSDTVVGPRGADSAHFVGGLLDKRQPDRLKRQVVRHVIQRGGEHDDVTFAVLSIHQQRRTIGQPRGYARVGVLREGQLGGLEEIARHPSSGRCRTRNRNCRSGRQSGGARDRASACGSGATECLRPGVCAPGTAFLPSEISTEPPFCTYLSISSSRRCGSGPGSERMTNAYFERVAPAACSGVWESTVKAASVAASSAVRT